MEKTQKKHFINQYFKLIGLVMSLGLSLTISAVYVLSHPQIGMLPAIHLLDFFEAKALDLRFKVRGLRKPGDDIIIIELDAKTEQELGRWQSSGRQWIAHMLDILSEDGVRVIGFDAAFVEPDPGSGPEAVDALRTTYVQHAEKNEPAYAEMLTAFEAIREAYDYDQQLAEAIRQAGNVVLGYYLFEHEGNTPQMTEREQAALDIMNQKSYAIPRFPAGTATHPLRLMPIERLKPNLPAFSDSAKSFGYFTLTWDSDSYIRHAPLLREYQGKYYPTLALEVARLYRKQPLPFIVHAIEREGQGSVDYIQLGQEYQIPTDERGRLLINYYGPARTFPYMSLSNVIQGNFDPGDFAGKIVLFGFTNPTYQDLHPVPFQPGTFPGVEIHATIAENIIRGDFLTQPEAAMLFDVLVLLVMGGTLGIVLLRVSPIRGFVAAIGGLLLIALVGYGAFLVPKIWLNVTYPAHLVVIEYLILTTYKYFAEDREKRRLKGAFKYYISPALVDQILSTSDELELGGEQKTLTTLFSDVRGFTKISERLTPAELVTFLEHLFTEMTNVVLGHGGTLDKYIGDAMMVFYGAPVDQPDHAVRACKSAVDMLLRLEELRIRWKAYNLPAINLGIGINSGEVVVGNIGSTTRFNYTVMGDAVNLASRLEGTNKQYGTNIIISEFTYDRIKTEAFTVRELDLVRVKGKETPVTIYELLGYDSIFQHQQALADTFWQGLNAYRKQEWPQAIEAFQTVLHDYPDDPPATIFIERCKTYQHTPPPEDWDGVFQMATK